MKQISNKEGCKITKNISKIPFPLKWNFHFLTACLTNFFKTSIQKGRKLKVFCNIASDVEQDFHT